MSAKKAPSSTSNSKVDRKNPEGVSGGIKTLLLCVLLMVLFCVCAYVAWWRIGPRVLASPEYSLGPQQLEITPPPAWIHVTNISGEIYRDISRDGPPSIMDDDLVERVHAAFSRHPWVAKVGQVSKQNPPPRVKAELIYRRPVCMVEVAAGLLPVDAEAVLLPTADFTPPEAAKYPRLIGIDRPPMGAVGARWGDSRVLGGAQIAAVLLPLWEKLELQHIAPIPPAETQSENAPVAAPTAARWGEYSFVITSRKGMKIFWGPSPATNAPGQPTPEQKVKKLEQFFAEHGSLDYPQGPRELDLQRSFIAN